MVICLELGADLLLNGCIGAASATGMYVCMCVCVCVCVCVCRDQYQALPVISG